MDSTSPDWVSEKLLAGVAGSVNPPVPWARIKAPRLGIYAPYTLTGRQAWYWYLKLAEQVAFDAAWPDIAAWYRRTIAKFAEGNAADTHTLPGAPHYLYISHEADVVRWMRGFLKIAPGT